MILILGIAALVALLGISIGLALCAAAVARRADAAMEPELVRALEPPPLADEPALTTKRFARDPAGRPIAKPRERVAANG